MPITRRFFRLMLGSDATIWLCLVVLPKGWLTAWVLEVCFE